MNYLHRYVPPIYVDLNMPATPSKPLDARPQPPTMSASSSASAAAGNSDPRPSCTNSLLLDLLEFPLTALEAQSELLKSDFELPDNGHDTPLGAQQQQIYPLPNGHEPGHDPALLKLKASGDPEVQAEAEAFPAAVFSNTTILTSRASTRSSVRASVAPPQRGGRTSQFSAKQRRERHNANERRRTNAAKGRVRDMRDAVDALLRERSDLTGQRDAQAPVQEVLPHRRRLETVVRPKSDAKSDVGGRIPGSSTYLDLVQAVDDLRNEKRYLEEQLDQLDSQNSALQAVQTELLIDGAVALTSGDVVTKSRKRKREDVAAAEGESPFAACKKQSKIDIFAGGYCMETEAVPSFLKVLFPKPMTSDAAFNWVKDSYSDIMQLKAQQKRTKAAASSVLGWREDKRQVTKQTGRDSGHCLELMLTKDLPGIVSGELVFNTWKLLTTLEGFRQLFPLTKDLAVLQTINDDCVVVRVGVAPAHDAPVVHSIVVLARGQIDGGYLVSMRSVPLSVGQTAFAAQETSYLPVLAWFMLLDKFDEFAQPVCEVIVGTSTQHQVERVLHGFATEFVAGVVRWQDAVGQLEQWQFE
ncbi:unnamed protein product [Hyaloperonospora brassicae]|uniref:BZIP domain-containing protein n=1 Tax=Hyaloperonospora brassicae TaxID=162125 RepID=A0AAV0UVW5_HYABA|nr:unnamed protein product [Hyaloperonospora brassicae]